MQIIKNSIKDQATIVKNHLEICLTSKAENVGVARLALAVASANAGLTINEVEELKVAISEAVSNSIIHAYEGDESQKIYIEYIELAENICISVTDTGRGIENIARAVEPEFSTKSDRMGLGFAFIHSFMDKVEIESKAGKGTTVKMIKKIRRA